MKRMKWNYFLAAGIITFTAFSVQAQVKKAAASTITFGIRAGVSLQNINGRDAADNKLENKLVPRFQGGVNVELPLADEFYVQPGLLFAGKGTEVKGSETDINISYIEIPVNFLYKPVVGNGKLLLGFGPYVGFGIGGTIKPKNGNSSDIEFENTISPLQAFTGTYFRKTDVGANLLFGYELSNMFSVQLNAQLGLAKINPDIEGLNNNNTMLKNTGFGLSVGYRF